MYVYNCCTSKQQLNVVVNYHPLVWGQSYLSSDLSGDLCGKLLCDKNLVLVCL